jgi:xanthine dehydrogenase large subunit
MLAFCVREALREAAAAFGPPGRSLELASPATPEAVFWAVEAARQGARDEGDGVRARTGDGVRAGAAPATGDGATGAAEPTPPALSRS